MDLASALKRSKGIQDWFDQELSSIEYPNTQRNMLACACFDMALEHYKAIVQLTNLRLTGSAFALARCVFESYIRGAWLFFCASEKEVKKYQKDTLKIKNMGLLIEDLERNKDFGSGILSRAKSATWKTLNGLTHSGYQQLGRRFRGPMQSPQYEDQDIVIIIKHATALAFLSVHMVARVAGNSELDARLERKAKAELGNF